MAHYPKANNKYISVNSLITKYYVFSYHIRLYFKLHICLHRHIYLLYPPVSGGPKDNILLSMDWKFITEIIPVEKNKYLK